MVFFFFFLLFISPINLSISKSEKQMVYRRCKNRVPLDLYRFNDGAILCSQSVGKSNSRLPSDVNVWEYVKLYSAFLLHMKAAQN